MNLQRILKASAVLAMIAAVLSHTMSANGEYILNGSFQDGAGGDADYWTEDGGFQHTDFGHDDLFSAHLESVQIWSQIIGTLPSGTYTLSGWWAFDDNYDDDGRVYITASNQGTIDGSLGGALVIADMWINSPGFNAWAFGSVDFSLASEATDCQVSLFSSAEYGHFDEISLTPEPAMVGLMALGIAGILAAKGKKKRVSILVLAALFFAQFVTQQAVADVFNMGGGLTSLEWVSVGNPGNADDTEGDGYGGVAYVYNIGKYEVTKAQYIEFLNAVAKTDTYGLYNIDMGGGSGHGGITRDGSSGSYTYTITDGDENWYNRPVNHVSWYDALRFVNWLQNGQPTGDQVDGVTEDGTYDFSGATSVILPDHSTLSTPHVVLPSEGEWYKAAYYDPHKPGGAGYWDYPTASDTAPSSESPPGTDLLNGSANYDFSGDLFYHITEVGAYIAKPSESACSTFDQGGNVSEWNEAEIDGGHARGARGGAFANGGPGALWAGNRGLDPPESEVPHVGFRVAQVPEPATVALMVMGLVGVVARRAKKLK